MTRLSPAISRPWPVTTPCSVVSAGPAAQRLQATRSRPGRHPTRSRSPRGVSLGRRLIVMPARSSAFSTAAGLPGVWSTIRLEIVADAEFDNDRAGRVRRRRVGAVNSSDDAAFGDRPVHVHRFGGGPVVRVEQARERLIGGTVVSAGFSRLLLVPSTVRRPQLMLLAGIMPFAPNSGGLGRRRHAPRRS